jgi:hypothetical protein
MWVWRPTPLRMILDIGLTQIQRGFLSSNRAGGQGYDDIYKFLETKNFFANKNYMEK